MVKLYTQQTTRLLSRRTFLLLVAVGGITPVLVITPASRTEEPRVDEQRFRTWGQTDLTFTYLEITFSSLNVTGISEMPVT